MKKNKSEILIFIGIVALVLAGFFCLSKSNSVVTTTEIPFEETSSVNYKVYLNDKTYYNREFLEEGMQYISSIIDYVDLNFSYDAVYENIKEYDVNKTIVASVKITDIDDNNKVIYSKSEVLDSKNETLNRLSLKDEIKVDYGKYNRLVNEIKTRYAISAKSVLTISYKINYVSKKDGLNTGKTLNVDIPLSEQMINITKPANTRIQDTFKGTYTDALSNTVMTILAILMFTLAAIMVVILVLKVRYRISKESKYDRFIAKVLREYDSYITEAKEESSLPYKDVIKVNSFKELLDVRNNVEKAIVYTKIDENTSKFQIIDEQIYEYLAERKEMDK